MKGAKQWLAKRVKDIPGIINDGELFQFTQIRMNQLSLFNPQRSRIGVFRYIEMFYNPVRLHESLDYITTLDFEKKFEQDLVRNESLVEKFIQ
jgi:hypothetical protein